MSNQVALIKLPTSDDNIIRCQGYWDINSISELDQSVSALELPSKNTLIIDGSAIQKMDSVGAWVLEKFIDKFHDAGKQIHYRGFSSAHETLLRIISEEVETLKAPLVRHKRPNWLHRVGKEGVNKLDQLYGFFTLIGELSYRFVISLSDPRRFQMPSIVQLIDLTGIRALPIVAVLMFLIGVVLAYQTGEQLAYYGADSLIVYVTGTTIIREFAPLITAIIIAGRTSSSFTAEIGLMKVNEEIDALRTMGLFPVERIVLPRLLALIIVFPLLVVWADIFGILGSMVISKQSFDIGFLEFLRRFQRAISLQQYFLGLVKAPFFAIIITLVGCYQGFQVHSSAQSVGEQTTRSVVQAIFLIIIADGTFSIIYSLLGL